MKEKTKKIKKKRKRNFTGLKPPRSFFTRREEKFFAGLGGSKAAKCHGKRAWLMTQVSTTGRPWASQSACTNEIEGSDVLALLGLDLQRDLGIVFDPRTNRGYRYRQDPYSKQWVDEEIVVCQTAHSCLPIIRIDQHQDAEAYLRRLTKPPMWTQFWNVTNDMAWHIKKFFCDETREYLHPGSWELEVEQTAEICIEEALSLTVGEAHTAMMIVDEGSFALEEAKSESESEETRFRGSGNEPPLRDTSPLVSKPRNKRKTPKTRDRREERQSDRASMVSSIASVPSSSQQLVEKIGSELSSSIHRKRTRTPPGKAPPTQKGKEAKTKGSKGNPKGSKPKDTAVPVQKQSFRKDGDPSYHVRNPAPPREPASSSGVRRTFNSIYPNRTVFNSFRPSPVVYDDQGYWQPVEEKNLPRPASEKVIVSRGPGEP